MPEGVKAILLDLDGVLFELVDHFGEYGVSPRSEEEIKIIEGLEELFAELLRAGFIILGHTNQPDISRNKITLEFIKKKHQTLLGKYSQIKKIYICPHTETDLCSCRKPKTGLLRQAGKEFNLDFSLCWVVGDSRSDIEAGVLVHAKTIFIQTQYNCASPAIDVCTQVVKSTKGALTLILSLSEGTEIVHDV